MRFSADYQQPIVEALGVLEDSGIDRFPVSLHAIQQQFCNLFQIYSYSALMKEEGISREECCRFLNSDDGVAVFDGRSKYFVFYNDKKMKQRIRFTIAHEIGHIFLDHHQEYGISFLGREGVSQELYKRLEKEANCFARNLLCPAYHTDILLDSHGISNTVRGRGKWEITKLTPLIENLKIIFCAKDLIETAFEVSPLAAKTRLDFLNADINHYIRNPLDWKSTSHIRHTAAWYCSHCGLERLPASTHCSECGKKHFVFQVSSTGFQYKDARLNDNMQFASCPVCGNTEFSESAGYCKRCGLPLSNVCTHDPTHLNHPEAKHCYACGKPTAFKDSEYHIQIRQSLEKYTEGDFSMIYKSEIKYDRKTNKVKECPRCQNEEFSADATYCRICGLPLVNNCIPGQWEDDFGNSYPRDSHENLPDSRFCEQCGEPTVYFQNKLLKTYREIQGLPEDDDKGKFDNDILF